jgi:exonuclease-1
MGIKDLLPNLKSISVQKNISEYSGQTVAIDGYCWYYYP